MSAETVEIINHGRDRLTFTAPRAKGSPSRVLLRIGSMDDRDHTDPKERPRQKVDRETYELLKKIPAFTAMVDKHAFTVI